MRCPRRECQAEMMAIPIHGILNWYCGQCQCLWRENQCRGPGRGAPKSRREWPGPICSECGEGIKTPGAPGICNAFHEEWQKRIVKA